jgi:alkanesulfonate monooxygenase SsuD/methylene tetrahydromethanopterin reductase-like flavin-dependent oxidoreductase (luciferase family)
MKLGILVETEEGLDWDSWRRVCAAAERLGFESVWISDHFLSPWVADRHGLDAWVALAVAAAETGRVALGPLVTPITFREPAMVARMAESLHDLSRGRFVIGLGLGWNAAEHAQAGIAFPPVAERQRRLDDGIRLIRRTLGERRVPLLIGGGGPRWTLPLVARYADHWNMTTSSVELYRARSERVATLCRAVGRDPARIRRSVAVGCLVGRDAAELGARCERMRAIVPPLAEAADVLEAARGMGWVVGTPGDVVGQLSALARAGIDLAILGHYDLDDQRALELIAGEVMPALVS